MADEELDGAAADEKRRRENAELEAVIQNARATSASARSKFLSMHTSQHPHELQYAPMQPGTVGPTQGAPQLSCTFEHLCALAPTSATPCVYVVDDFLSDAECEHLVAFGKRRVKHLTKMRPLLEAMAAGPLLEPGEMIEWRADSVPDAVARDVERRIGSLMGAPPHELEGGLKLKQTLFQRGFDDAYGSPRVTDGAHVDVNKHEHRWGTCIIYLTSLDEADGGETCFPLAEDPPAALISDASLLVSSGCYHTENAADESQPLADAATRLLAASERSARGHSGLAVRPRKGRVCVFYTRQPDAEVDPRSFHFGAAVRTPHKEKWTCQIFKALPMAARQSASERQSFMQKVHPSSARGVES